MSCSRSKGRLVAVEGLDGAGKHTLVSCVAFPRYEVDIHAELARDALAGGLGDLAGSVEGMALLFALDRRAAIPDVLAARERGDVVLADRYVASNAAYSAARRGEPAGGPTVARIAELETRRFGVPVPDRQVLLDVEPGVASERVRGREREHAERARDAYESDAGLQRRCARVYRELAAGSWLSPWSVIDAAAEVDYGRVAAELLAV
jgi:dTMP kinase